MLKVVKRLDKQQQKSIGISVKNNPQTTSMRSLSMEWG